MNNNKIKIDALASACSIVWIAKYDIPLIPFLSLIYFIFRSLELKEINLNKYKFIVCMSIIALFYVMLHALIGEINLIKNFARILLPILMSSLMFFILNQYNRYQFKVYLKSLFWYFNFIGLIDFIKFSTTPYYALTAPFNPYLMKAKTLLFPDGNWVGYISLSLEFLSYCIKNAEDKKSKIMRVMLIYFSGSRTAIVGLIIFKLYDLFKYIINKYTEFNFFKFKQEKNNLSDKLWVVINTRIFSFLFVFLITVGLPILLLNIFPLESFSIEDNIVGFSSKDGSFRTKLYLINYSLNAIFNPFVLIFGWGPQLELIRTSYSGHSLFGSLPELGLVGISLITFSHLLFIFNLRSYCIFYLSTLLFISSFAFYPYAYMTPIHTLILFIAYKFRSRKLSKGEVINI